MSQLSLYRASFHGDHEKVSRLLNESQTQVDAANDLGETALHCSCSSDNSKTTLLLLQGGANPNAKNIHGETPLHYAAINHLKRSILYLLHYGADMNIRSTIGSRPIDLAVQPEIINLFKEFEKKVVSNYAPLIQLLTVDDMKYGVDLCHCVTVGDTSRKEKDYIARSLTTVYESCGVSFSFLSKLISYEVENTVHETTLFRTDSIGTKIMTLYAKLYGQAYLKKTIGSLILRVANDPVGYELDTTRVSEEEASENTIKLRVLCGEFLANIAESFDICPRPIKAICYHLQKVVGDRFPDSRYLAIAGFLFLRYFSAAISNPESYGIIPEGSAPLQSEHRRPLVLVAKTLQNLANGVEYGAKEPYMIPMNIFLQRSAQSFREFLDRFTSPDASIIDDFSGFATRKDASSADLVFLHTILQKMLPILSTYYDASSEKQAQALALSTAVLDIRSKANIVLHPAAKRKCHVAKCDCIFFGAHTMNPSVCFRCEHTEQSNTSKVQTS
eukprot:TRINITY_DN8050_c0_g1_i14.p1 TRINITY_DN8050_c0_g1~~TRINITY_DN8050_c0_g1_i14.p1  ORF type:complete len:502 (+),score=66.72 TRINITY_DN8050_c0_g1_i14:43-1548(+)